MIVQCSHERFGCHPWCAVSYQIFRGGIDIHFIDPLTINETQIMNCALVVPADVDYVHYLLLHYRHCVPSIKLCPISQAQNTNRKTHFLSLTISSQCPWTRVANLQPFRPNLCSSVEYYILLKYLHNALYAISTN